MMRQAQIIVGCEIDVFLSVDFYMHCIDWNDGDSFAKLMLRRSASQFLLKQIVKPMPALQLPAFAHSALDSAVSSSGPSGISAISLASSSIEAPVRSLSFCFIRRPTLNLTVRFSGTSTGCNVLGF